MSTTTQSTKQNLTSLTEAQRKALAVKIVKARTDGTPWDGENGIVNDARFPLINSAQQGRKLLREVAKDELIAKSYDRSAKGLVGPRTADAKPKPKPAPKKTRKPAAKK